MNSREGGGEGGGEGTNIRRPRVRAERIDVDIIIIRRNVEFEEELWNRFQSSKARKGGIQIYESE